MNTHNKKRYEIIEKTTLVCSQNRKWCICLQSLQTRIAQWLCGFARLSEPLCTDWHQSDNRWHFSCQNRKYLANRGLDPRWKGLQVQFYPHLKALNTPPPSSSLQNPPAHLMFALPASLHCLTWQQLVRKANWFLFKNWGRKFTATQLIVPPSFKVGLVSCDIWNAQSFHCSDSSVPAAGPSRSLGALLTIGL